MKAKKSCDKRKKGFKQITFWTTVSSFCWINKTAPYKDSILRSIFPTLFLPVPLPSPILPPPLPITAKVQKRKRVSAEINLLSHSWTKIHFLETWTLITILVYTLIDEIGRRHHSNVFDVVSKQKALLETY